MLEESLADFGVANGEVKEPLREDELFIVWLFPIAKLILKINI